MIIHEKKNPNIAPNKGIRPLDFGEGFNGNSVSEIIFNKGDSFTRENFKLSKFLADSKYIACN
jgi:hypothetical protein